MNKSKHKMNRGYWGLEGLTEEEFDLLYDLSKHKGIEVLIQKIIQPRINGRTKRLVSTNFMNEADYEKKWMVDRGEIKGYTMLRMFFEKVLAEEYKTRSEEGKLEG